MMMRDCRHRQTPGRSHHKLPSDVWPQDWPHQAAISLNRSNSAASAMSASLASQRCERGASRLSATCPVWENSRQSPGQLVPGGEQSPLILSINAVCRQNRFCG